MYRHVAPLGLNKPETSCILEAIYDAHPSELLRRSQRTANPLNPPCQGDFGKGYPLQEEGTRELSIAKSRLSRFTGWVPLQMQRKQL